MQIDWIYFENTPYSFRKFYGKLLHKKIQVENPSKRIRMQRKQGKFIRNIEIESRHANIFYWRNDFFSRASLDTFGRNSEFTAVNVISVMSIRKENQ